MVSEKWQLKPSEQIAKHIETQYPGVRYLLVLEEGMAENAMVLVTNIPKEHAAAVLQSLAAGAGEQEPAEVERTGKETLQ